MTVEEKEMLLDLLVKKVTTGFDGSDAAEYDRLSTAAGLDDAESFELAAAAIAAAGLGDIEPMPATLRSSLESRADEWFSSAAAEGIAFSAPDDHEEMQQVFTLEPPKMSWTSWLGWVFAAAACVVLAVNIYQTRQQDLTAGVPPTRETPATPDPARAHDELASQPGVIVAEWSAGSKDPELASVAGDVVWSDEKQTGYMKFRNLPANDKSKTTYQLWIFEENQGDKTPIDGGVFDVDANGEVVIPIEAKLKTRKPFLFAVTVEKPGGVVVSKREKIAALAKVTKA